MVLATQQPTLYSHIYYHFHPAFTMQLKALHDIETTQGTVQLISGK
jgi:hypothetical protein